MNLESDVDENDVDVDVEESDVDVVEPPPPSTCPRVRIAVGAGIALNVRPQANTNGAQVSKVYRGMVLAVLSTTNTGQAVNGNTKWYEIDAFGTHGFITAEYAECTSDRLTKLAPPKEFYLPLKCKTSSRITQGNNGGFSHTGLYKYSWDFGIPIGTPLVAMADGLVLHTYAGTAKGSSCDGGGASCQPYANHVVLLHGD